MSCKGSGVIQGTKNIKFTIPAGCLLMVVFGEIS